MMQITDGRVVLSVTPGAYRDIYAPQGFQEVNTEALPEDKNRPAMEPEAQGGNLLEVTPESVSEDKSDASEDIIASEAPEAVADLSEIPLSEMNSGQLKAYAKQLGVDLKGMTSKKAVREKIKAAL